MPFPVNTVKVPGDETLVGFTLKQAILSGKDAFSTISVT